MNNKQNKNLMGGFTLIELMVAISIFMIIMTIALGSLLVASDTSSKARELGTAMDNVNFAMESMTRSIRMGTDYTCIPNGMIEDKNGPNFPITSEPLIPVDSNNSGCKALAFKSASSDSAEGDNVYYALNDRGNGSYGPQKCTGAGGCLAGMVSDEVNINDLRFFVKNATDTTDGIQPSVYILMKGTVDVKGIEFPFALQTLASQRNLE